MDSKFEWLEQRTTTPDGVYRVLRAAILDGAVPPGGQLREARIAADLGISRSPLREALTKLEEEGLIVKIPFRGAFVVEVSAEDVAEIASIRLLVEPYAAELSAEALRGPQRATLMQTVEDLNRATQDDDIPASIDAHLRFHRLFYDLSGHRPPAEPVERVGAQAPAVPGGRPSLVRRPARPRRRAREAGCGRRGRVTWTPSGRSWHATSRLLCGPEARDTTCPPRVRQTDGLLLTICDLEHSVNS